MPIKTGTAHAVIANRANQAGHNGAMAHCLRIIFIIKNRGAHIIAIFHKIPAVNVVAVTVVIIILTVIRNFIRVSPDISA